MPSRNTKARNAGKPPAEASGLPRGPGPLLMTPRLVLRPFRIQDAPAVAAYASSPGFFRFVTGVPAPVQEHYTLAHARDHIRDLQHLQASGYPSWALVLRTDREAGPVGAIRFNRGAGLGVPELGYGLHAQHRGKGLMAEAGKAVLAWADRHVAVTGAACAPGNTPSLRILEGLGYVQSGTTPDGRLTLLRQAPSPPGNPVAAATKP